MGSTTIRRRALGGAAALALAAAAAATPGAEDLRAVYPATRAHSDVGLTAVCGPEDVWELKSFELSLGKHLRIACKQAVVAFGRDGTDVLWAAVFPERPLELEADGPGDGEHAAAVFLRFAPSELGALFPKKTVKGRGGAWRRAEAQRLAAHKCVWRWCTPSGRPTVVPAGWTLVDVDTREGPRRFWGLERAAGRAHYIADFEGLPLPPSPPIARAEALAAFDAVWEAFDREYAGFVLLPRLDWDRLGKAQRKLAGEADTVYALAAVIADGLAQLEDLHVWVKAGEEFVPGYTRDRPLNASWEATRALAGATNAAGKDLAWGRTADGIGCLIVTGLSDPELPAHVDAALEELADTWALVVDLRFNGGGDELLAREVAGRFVDEERVYSMSRYRSGSKRDALGPPQERRVAPRGPWRYRAPVVALWGQRTMSSAESLALMLAQCPQVVTMGDRSAGSSANPRRLELECGIAVNLPRWLDLDPDGNPIEHVGVAPEVRVEAAPEAFTAARDPVLEAALERLRAIPAGERGPGRR